MKPLALQKFALRITFKTNIAQLRGTLADFRLPEKGERTAHTLIRRHENS